MTLHWWMHWFWVTALLSLLASDATTAAPQSEELQHITTDIELDQHHLEVDQQRFTAQDRDANTEKHEDTPKESGTTDIAIETPVVVDDEQEKPSEREGRAMYFTKVPTRFPPIPINATDTNKTIDPTPKNVSANISEISHPSIEWTAVNATENNTTIDTLGSPSDNVTKTLFSNVSDSQNTTFTKRRNLTRPDFAKDDTAIEGVSESRIVTEKPLSLETTYLQTRIPQNIESFRRVVDDSEGGMDTGVIAGISFAALVLAALAGSTAFVLYRRRYLNKPQTLNDKCSNPDSSGYLDDSTIRDNSEEMYSLDNDSFLNSLEAMTIQNYWTDTVKHTKL